MNDYCLNRTHTYTHVERERSDRESEELDRRWHASIEPSEHVGDHHLTLGLVEYLMVETLVHLELLVGGLGEPIELSRSLGIDEEILGALHQQERPLDLGSLAHGDLHR